MKKHNFVITILVTAIITSIAVLGAQQYQLIIDGKDIKCDMIVKNGVTYLPLRTISNELGLELKFDNGVIRLNTSTLSMANNYMEKLRLMDQEVDNVGSADTMLEMKQASSALFKKWDDVLNEIYGVLKNQLSGSEMELLRKEQREWIVLRDTSAEESASKYKGGTMEGLEYSQTLVYMTRQRCYELVEIYMK